MSLPRQVQEAADKAEAIYKEIYEQQPEQEAQPETPPEAPPSEPVVTEEASAEAQGEPQETEGSQEPVGIQQDTKDWEHLYKVLSGKYSSEVPRVAAENRELKESIRQLEDKVNRLSTTQSNSKESLVRQDEIDEYGQPLIDVIRRAAREELSAKDAELDELKARMETFDSKVTRNVEVDFYEDLGRRSPEWVAINDDQNFHKWLEGYDELTGQRRQDLLSKAEADRDARRVSNFFSAYIKTNQSLAATANRSLESQVVPQTKTHNESPPAKRVWTRGEIQTFYARMRTGDISGADAVAIEADIQAAAVEGRVR